MTRTVSAACADYFTGFQVLSAFSKNDTKTNAFGFLLVASYFTVIIPVLVGLIYGASSLIGRVSVSNSQSPDNQKTSSVVQKIFGQPAEDPDPYLVVTTANRILADIDEINKKRGPIKFSYTASREVRDTIHSNEKRDHTARDKDAAIAVIHQKITQHVEGLNIIVPSPKYETWGIKTWGDISRTYYLFSQELLDSKTKKVIAKMTFRIDHTDKTKFPLFSNNIEGIIQSEIALKPFQIVK